MATTAKVVTPVAGDTGMFLRKATGLVREVSTLDAVVLNSAGMNVGVGVGLLFLQAPSLLTGGSIFLAIVLCTLGIALATAYNYSVAAGAFPRSGADYVFSSRVLGPVWGFMMSGSQVLWNFFWMAFNAWFATSVVFPGVLTVLSQFANNPGLADLAGKISSTATVFIIAIILQILFSLLHTVGIKAYFTYLKITFFIAALSVLIGAFILLIQGSNFVANWNSFMAGVGGLSYDQVISTAIQNGFNPDAPFSLGKTLAMMPLVFWIVGFFNGSPQIGGEVKRARSAQFIAMVVAVLINGAIVALLAVLVNTVIGGRFLSSLGYLWFNQGALLKLGSQPDFNFMVSVLARSAPVVGFLGLGYLFWAINATPNILALVTRTLLAYSFDRMAPDWIGDVSEKYHTPIKAIIFTAFMGFVAVIILIVWKQASLLSSIMAQMFTYLVMAVAAIVFPFKFPKLWESTTSARKVFGIPLLTISGVVSLLFIGLMSYYFGFYPMFGANTSLSLTAVGISILACVVYYFVFRAYQKSRGVDVDLAYKEIPPE